MTHRGGSVQSPGTGGVCVSRPAGVYGGLPLRGEAIQSVGLGRLRLARAGARAPGGGGLPPTASAKEPHPK